jgi:putative MFS transporter
MAGVTGQTVSAPSRDTRAFWSVFALHWRPILASAFLWFLYDLVVYGAILFGPNIIAKSLGLGAGPFQILMQLVFILPASVIGSLFIIDQVGRKPLQALGFLGSAVFVVVFALMQSQLTTAPILGFIVFGLFNVASTGPGLVSGAGIFGVELAPTRIRSVAQSITVAGGRIGASISAFYFPLLFSSLGGTAAYWVIAAISVVGAIATWLLVPETGRISLEQLTEAQPSPA